MQSSMNEGSFYEEDGQLTSSVQSFNSDNWLLLYSYGLLQC